MFYLSKALRHFGHTKTLSHLHIGCRPFCPGCLAAAQTDRYCLATPKRPWMQMQRSSFARTIAIRAYCQLYYCCFGSIIWLLVLCALLPAIINCGRKMNWRIQLLLVWTLDLALSLWFCKFTGIRLNPFEKVTSSAFSNKIIFIHYCIGLECEASTKIYYCTGFI